MEDRVLHVHGYLGSNLLMIYDIILCIVSNEMWNGDEMVYINKVCSGSLNSCLLVISGTLILGRDELNRYR